MRRTTSHRVGALGLSLLLQLFVLSGLLHPCCLGMAEAETASVDAAQVHHAAATDHGEATHSGASSHAAHTAPSHHDAGPHGSHDGGSHDGGSHDGGSHDGDCAGDCGFCCSTASPVGLPAFGIAVAAATPPAPGAIVSTFEAQPRSSPRFILPFAIGPPATPTTSV